MTTSTFTLRYLYDGKPRSVRWPAIAIKNGWALHATRQALERKPSPGFQRLTVSHIATGTSLCKNLYKTDATRLFAAVALHWKHPASNCAATHRVSDAWRSWMHAAETCGSCSVAPYGKACPRGAILVRRTAEKAKS